jgi:hypothetical protein
MCSSSSAPVPEYVPRNPGLETSRMYFEKGGPKDHFAI